MAVGLSNHPHGTNDSPVFDSNLLCALISTNNLAVEEVHHFPPVKFCVFLKPTESLGEFGPASEVVLLFVCVRVGIVELQEDDC
jgi:hypothetical protein